MEDMGTKQQDVIAALGATLLFLDRLREQLDSEQYRIVEGMRSAGASWDDVSRFLASPVTPQGAGVRFRTPRRRLRS